MRSYPTAITDQLALKNVGVRDLLSITVRSRSDVDTTQTFRFWSGSHDKSIDVIDPFTGSSESRTFEAAGANIQMSAISYTSGLVVTPLTIQFSRISDRMGTVLRTWDPRLAPVEVHRVYLNPESLQPIATAQPKFIGFVDENPETIPEPGNEGSWEVVCVPHTQELLRVNPATRSDSDQRRRGATDNFYRHTADVGQWEMWWGQLPE